MSDKVITEKDYETNSTYMLDRYYSQGYGRFLSPDPGYDYDQLDPMSWNLYSYVRGNPINNVDPTGEVTFGIGLNASGGLMYGGGGTIMVVIDSKFNIGIATSKAHGPMAVVSASLNLVFQFTSAENIHQLNGKSLDIGGSVGELGSVGMEFVESEKDVYRGENIYIGVTIPKLPLPFELHGFIDNTSVFPDEKASDSNSNREENDKDKELQEKLKYSPEDTQNDKKQEPSYNKFIKIQIEKREREE